MKKFMKLLFVHDHRFQRNADDRLVTSGSFPASIWPRYLEHFQSVHVFARDGGTVDSDRMALAEEQGVSFELIAPPGFAERLGLQRGTATQALARAVERSDAVICRLPSDLGLIAKDMAIQYGKPWLLEIVGCAYDGYGNQGSQLARAYAPLARYRMKRAARQAPMSVYVTDRWLQERYPPGPQTIATGVSDVVIAEPNAEDIAARERRLSSLFEGRKPIIGTVASLRTASKGLQTMFEALALRNKLGKAPLEYRVLGGGDAEPWRAKAAAAGISSQVHFDGVRSAGDQVHRWLDGIDIHAQPSFQEGLPRATIEAMSRGCACIGSTVGGIPELIEAARLHPPGDSVGLAAIVSTLEETPEELARAARRDRHHSEKFAPDIIYERRSHVFRALAEAARSRN